MVFSDNTNEIKLNAATLKHMVLFKKDSIRRFCGILVLEI